ncbi:adenylate/guanylate cyclase domain-containing protein [Bradyrhizobium japonicum]|jgi:adenylate cyclase|uniref:Adenylate cyclase n=1 Tax=Bradyrhizobium japonicum TaxID=375 RepID=A0ABV2RMR6_BRAJP|nr:adenylate/guanylate cyclase domain-containing protein [Bradyrhizobium japonicum]MCP1762948.1 adenylate cyclase [Bradyrhizobium japonicum]MCP1785082.1 adenylate cyclase [Bradyrhizobium japonicum]MCP1806963.1 adenylate cyclase [Bradyrhizobium japonicum]MCP1815888.1 adenylate cyclase [Bradyrhizobium japonicum]MCP1872596.1 adenylate cyclase [Bradyrhizobium japonicum]
MSDLGEVSRKLVAVFAADVEGYSRLMGADEVGTLKGLTQRRAILDRLIGEYRGRIANTAGDSVLAEFGSAVDAVQCAVEAQTAFAEANSSLAPDRPISFRIGIHIGDVMIRAGDLFGEGVNLAARLQSIAKPGGVCISGVTYDQVRKVLPMAFVDLGVQQVKNIQEPIRTYEVNAPSETREAAHARVSEAESPPPLPDKPSIAVLPFQNMSGDPDQEYFADGMVEEIITALSRNKQLFVIARNSSFTFKGKAVDIKQVGRDLGVRYVLEGSVRKSGSRIRIAGQLIDAASGAHLWADRYDGALEDIFALQDQVASSVAGAIAPSVSQAEMERAKRKPTSNLDAYDCYLRAEAAHFEYTRDATDRAIGFYRQAIALDPQFALANAAMAATMSTRRAWGWSTDPEADKSQAIMYAKAALRMERKDALVLARSALVLTFNSDEVELADSLLDEAVRLDPNGMSGWIWGGWTKSILGAHRTAIDYHQRALRLSPLDVRITFAHEGLAFAHFFLGNYEEGLRCAADVLRHHPTHVQGLRITMACHAMLGNMEAAQKSWQQVALLSPSDRVTETRRRSPWRDQDIAKLQEAYRLAGVPE